MSPVEDAVIREFCSQESDAIHGGGRRRRSVLIQIMRDMDYNLGVYRIFKELDPTPEQLKKLESEVAPLLVPPLLLASAIDSLARVLTCGRRTTTNRAMFIDSAQKLFGMDVDDAQTMWSLRNSLSHAYSLRGFSFVRSLGGGSGSAVQHVIATRPMRGYLRTASTRLEEILLGLPHGEKVEVCRHLEEHGFLYYRASDNTASEKSN